MTRALWLVFWITALAGLFMSGKVDDPSTESLPVLPETRLALDAEGEPDSTLEAGADGSSRLRIAVHFPSTDAESQAVMAWLAAKPDLNIAVDFAPLESTDGEGPQALRFEGSDLKAVSSEVNADESLLVIAAAEVQCRAGRRYRVQTAVSGDDRFFRELDPMVLIGASREFVLPPTRDPIPGLLMLLGAMGVVSHLAMMLGRLLVPLQPALPSD
jgi:hypothetical protein